MNEPLYVRIKQYRIVAISITVFFMILTWNMWDWFQSNHKEMHEWANASFSSLALLAAGAVKWSLENMAKGYEKDGEN